MNASVKAWSADNLWKQEKELHLLSVLLTMLILWCGVFFPLCSNIK